jgi:hypothetical protein
MITTLFVGKQECNRPLDRSGGKWMKKKDETEWN